MSWIPLMGIPFFTRNWAPVTKKVRLKSTLSRRGRVSVMVPAIRSTAPDDRSGIRVAGVDSFFSSFTGLPTLLETAGRMSCSTRSMEKPTHSFCLLTYAKGGEPVRVPMVRVPVRAIFSSVVSATAGATLASITASATRRLSSRFIVSSLV